MKPDNPLSSKKIHDGKIVKLSVDEVALPDGRTCELEIIRHQGAAAVVPIDDAGCAILVRQYRYAADGWLLEVPAGKLDPGEAPETCAVREAEEETGFRIGRLVPLGWIWTTPGFTDEKIWLYAGLDLSAGEQELQADELIEVLKMPLREAAQAAADGSIRDGKTVITLLRASALKGLG